MTAPSLKRALPPVYAAAALRIAFPLVVLPVMAARLGADEFGRLSLFLVWAGLLSTLVEGGFLAAATRAAVAADAAGRTQLARQVFSARCVLSALLLPLAALVAWTVPQAPAQQPWLSGLALAALACALGWPATWYLQASQQLHRWAFVELVVYGVWLGAALAFAHSVLAYLVLNLLAVGTLAALGWRWLKRDLAAAALWSRGAVRPGLQLGWTMLPVSITGAAYSYALPAVASAQMNRGELGLYYLIDRVVRSLIGAADPLFQLIYPRIVARFADGARAALRYVARWAAAGFVAGLLLLAGAALGWPLWARGLDAAHARPVFAVLGVLLPLLLGWKFFGYWMLGSGRYDRAYRLCVAAGAVCGVAGALSLAGRGALALAGVALAVELVVIAVAVSGIALTERARRLA